MIGNELAPDAVKPVIVLAARIGWRIRFSEILFEDPPCQVLQAMPVFPGCSDKLTERGIVWDAFALVEAPKRAGGTADPDPVRGKPRPSGRGRIARTT